MADDRISQVLRDYIALAYRQLRLAEEGVVLPDVEATTTALPNGVAELMCHIANLEGALDRHEGRRP